MARRPTLLLLLTSRRLRQRWITRVVVWAAAAIAGLVVVGFAMVAELAMDAFFSWHARWPWMPFVLTPAIGMLVVGLTRRYVPGATGSGIPQVVAATRIAALGEPVSHLLSMRVAAGKVVLGTVALLGGYSAGREGPSVQVAAAILNAANRFLPKRGPRGSREAAGSGPAIRQADLILAGGAAGLAAAFNTPLAGIVFAVEELGRRLESRTSGVLVSTIIISGLVSIALKGNYTYFGHLTVHELGTTVLLPALIAGGICGTLGGLFSTLLLWPHRFPDWAPWVWQRKHPVWFAGGCGLVIAVLGWISGGTSYGSGYLAASQAINGGAALEWHAPITRFFATIATYFSGIPGGIFAPALAVGTALGVDLSHWIGLGIDRHAWIALCMAAFLAAVTQSPITAAIIVMEMVNGHEMVISLMGVAFLAKTISAWFGPELYQQLAAGWFTEPPPVPEEAPRRLPLEAPR